MVLPRPPQYSEPIPQGPFYSPESENLCTQIGPIIVGSGLAVCYATGTIVALGDGTGTVQEISTGEGLIGGPITVSGTIALAPISSAPQGAYIYPTALDVDQYGRVTSVISGGIPVLSSAFAAKGDILAGTGFPGSYSALPPGDANQVLVADPAAPLGIKWLTASPDGVLEVTGSAPIAITNPLGPITNVAIDPASLTSCGAVQLTDSLSSTSTDLALTASAGKSLQDQVDQLQTDKGTVYQVWGTFPITIAGDPAVNPIVEVAPSSTTQLGVVQLNDTVTSTSVVEAATANSVKTTYDIATDAQTTANAALPRVGGTMTGDILFTDGQPVDAGFF